MSMFSDRRSTSIVSKLKMVDVILYCTSGWLGSYRIPGTLANLLSPMEYESKTLTSARARLTAKKCIGIVKKLHAHIFLPNLPCRFGLGNLLLLILKVEVLYLLACLAGGTAILCFVTLGSIFIVLLVRPLMAKTTRLSYTPSGNLLHLTAKLFQWDGETGWMDGEDLLLKCACTGDVVSGTIKMEFNSGDP